MFIKQTDLKASYLSHKDEIDREIIEVMESGWYILGEKVASFETNFAKYIRFGHMHPLKRRFCAVK